MISIETMDGELVKILSNIENKSFGIHELFGLISEKKAIERQRLKKRQGHDFFRNKWLCNFEIISDNNKRIHIACRSNCEVEQIENDFWKLTTPVGMFKISSHMNAIANPIIEESIDHQNWLNRLVELFFIIIFLTLPILYFLNQNESESLEKIDEKKEPIKVTIVKPKNTVTISMPKAAMDVTPLTQEQKAQRAVKRNLGFLGLVGSSSVKNVTGGVPQKLEQATAGAGAGGDAGSGGELLVGLGKGLKKTTVGNTGVAGLGGVGTKGAGGGKGGYGNTLVASGEGNGISAISVSSNDVVLDGGLSRYAINATIAKYINQVRRCYEDGLKTNPSMEGLVTVNFEIAGSGMLNFSKVIKSSLSNQAVEKCITTKMMSWKFPLPKGGTTVNVNYPFMLRPVGI